MAKCTEVVTPSLIVILPIRGTAVTLPTLNVFFLFSSSGKLTVSNTDIKTMVLQKLIIEEVKKKQKEPESESDDADDFDNVFEDTGSLSD